MISGIIVFIAGMLVGFFVALFMVALYVAGRKAGQEEVSVTNVYQEKESS